METFVGDGLPVGADVDKRPGRRFRLDVYIPPWSRWFGDAPGVGIVLHRLAV